MPQSSSKSQVLSTALAISLTANLTPAASIVKNVVTGTTDDKAYAETTESTTKSQINDTENEDTYYYDGVDSIVTTKTGLERNISTETFGEFDRSAYGIPGVQTADQDLWDQIKAENKEVMSDLETKIEEGTLGKHVAADGQYGGTVSDTATAVEKEVYINTKTKGYHSTSTFIPAGEIATITIPDEYLPLFQSGDLKITVGLTQNDATSYDKGGKDRMPYLSYTFDVSTNTVKVGTPFGGMISVYVANKTYDSAYDEVKITVNGAVDTPYYQLGSTTLEEWQELKNAPGLYAEFRTQYARIVMPASEIRDIEDPREALEFWNNVGATSTYAYNQNSRTLPTTLLFDDYVPAGAAVSFVGAWYCVLPTSWANGALNYDNIMTGGCWGIIHEFNHHWCGIYMTGNQWGLVEHGTSVCSEVTNNVMSTASYLLYTNIAATRTTSAFSGWNNVTDPYWNYVTATNSAADGFTDNPYEYAVFMHEFGVENFLEVVKSNYYQATFNGITLSPYSKTWSRVDDMANRLCVVNGYDMTEYMTQVLKWDISDEMLEQIKSYGFEEYFPVTNLYSTGVKGVETGRTYYIQDTGSYDFDFETYTGTPGTIDSIEITKQPTYGTLEKVEGTNTYHYTTGELPQDTTDTMEIRVTATYNGITNTRTLPISIGYTYTGSTVEKYTVTSNDLEQAILEANGTSPYQTTAVPSVNFSSDNGKNLTKGSGWFTVTKTGTYEFQTYGDDKTKFLLTDDDTTLTSTCSSYYSEANQAYSDKNSSSFEVELQAGKTYYYELYCLNTGGAGNGNVAYRESGTTSWKALPTPYLASDKVGTTVNLATSQPTSLTYKRENQILTGVQYVDTSNALVTSTPIGENGSDPQAIVDGDTSTYFHSAYYGNMTALPHEYVIDYNTEKTFNTVIINTRESNTNGTIGNYNLYASNDGETWELISSCANRTSTSSTTITADLGKNVTTRYLKIEALDNKNGNNFTIISEVKLANTTSINETIGQNNSSLEYFGDWTKDKSGVYVNGAVYVGETGARLKYSFTGTSTSLYTTTDAVISVMVDGETIEYGKYVTGDKYSPAYILNYLDQGTHNVEITVLSGELSVNALASDGTFSNYEDSQAPIVLEPVLVDGSVTTKGCKLVFNASDNESLLKKYEVYVDGVLSKTGQLNSRETTITELFDELTANSSHEIRVVFYDEYGNSSEQSFSFETRELPKITFSSVSNNKITMTLNDEIALLSQDDSTTQQSFQITYSINGGTQQTVQMAKGESTNVNVNNGDVLTVTVSDGTNTSEEQTKTIVILAESEQEKDETVPDQSDNTDDEITDTVTDDTTDNSQDTVEDDEETPVTPGEEMPDDDNNNNIVNDDITDNVIDRTEFIIDRTEFTITTGDEDNSETVANNPTSGTNTTVAEPSGVTSDDSTATTTLAPTGDPAFGMLKVIGGTAITVALLGAIVLTRKFRNGKLS